MTGPGKRAVALAACAGALALGGAAVATAANENVTAAEECCEFLAASYSIDAGTVGQFQNDTDTVHDIEAGGKGPDREPLFVAKQVKSGTVPINGTQYLSPGDYPFICLIHGSGMSATLKVLPTGTPQKRPSVTVTLPAQDLATAASSGKLKATLKGKVGATGLTLVASKGKTTLGTLRKASVSTGKTKNVTIPLTGSAKAALKRLDKAAIQLELTVPFGKTAKASKTLR